MRLRLLLLVPLAACAVDEPVKLRACNPPAASGEWRIESGADSAISIDSVRWDVRAESGEFSVDVLELLAGRVTARATKTLAGIGVLYESRLRDGRRAFLFQPEFAEVLSADDIEHRALSEAQSARFGFVRTTTGRSPSDSWGCPASARLIRKMDLAARIGLVATAARDSAARLAALRKTGPLAALQLLRDTLLETGFSHVFTGVAVNTTSDTLRNAALWVRVSAVNPDPSVDTLVFAYAVVPPHAIVSFGAPAVANEFQFVASGAWVNAADSLIAGDAEEHSLTEARRGAGQSMIPGFTQFSMVGPRIDLSRLNAGEVGKLVQSSLGAIALVRAIGPGARSVAVMERRVFVIDAPTGIGADTASLRLSSAAWQHFIAVLDSVFHAHPEWTADTAHAPQPGRDQISMVLSPRKHVLDYPKGHPPPELARLVALTDSFAARLKPVPEAGTVHATHAVLAMAERKDSRLPFPLGADLNGALRGSGGAIVLRTDSGGEWHEFIVAQKGRDDPWIERRLHGDPRAGRIGEYSSGQTSELAALIDSALVHFRGVSPCPGVWPGPGDEMLIVKRNDACVVVYHPAGRRLPALDSLWDRVHALADSLPR